MNFITILSSSIRRHSDFTEHLREETNKRRKSLTGANNTSQTPDPYLNP